MKEKINMAKVLTGAELINSHRPKKVSKYKFIIKDSELFEELRNDESFDMKTLDTIKNDDLVNTGYNRDFDSYERDVVARAKEPTTIDEKRGIVVSKQLITKADKKLINVCINTFDYDNASYVMIKFVYERFDIVEIFLLVQ